MSRKRLETVDLINVAQLMGQLDNSPRVKQVKIDARLHQQLKIRAAKTGTTIRAIIEDALSWVVLIPSKQQRQKFAKERGQYGTDKD